MGTLTFHWSAVISRVFAGGTGCFERQQTNDALWIRHIPLPPRHCEPSFNFYLHISMNLEEVSVQQLALASEQELNDRPGQSPEKRLFKEITLQSPKHQRRKLNWSLMNSQPEGLPGESFSGQSMTRILRQPVVNLPGKIRVARSKRRLDTLKRLTHTHTHSEFSLPPIAVLDRSIREHRLPRLDHRTGQQNLRLKRNALDSSSVLPSFPSFNGSEVSPRQILAARKAQFM